MIKWQKRARKSGKTKEMESAFHGIKSEPPEGQLGRQKGVERPELQIRDAGGRERRVRGFPRGLN